MYIYVLEIELGGTDLFQHAKIQNFSWFPLDFPYFSSIFRIFMYEKINDFIVGMVTAHDKGYMLVVTTFAHTYIFLWEPIVHDHSGSK